MSSLEKSTIKEEDPWNKRPSSRDRGLNGMRLGELEAWIEEHGQAAFRAKQVFHFLHVERGRDFQEARVLPKDLRLKLVKAPLRLGRILGRLDSKDGSRKYLMAFADQSLVETVYMPYADRSTICISTQVGCRMGCAFCASTKASFGRNLYAEEMLEQVYLVEKENGPIDHLVLMGIGEGLDNYEELLRFLDLISSPQGKHLGLRHITLSTCGLVDRMLDLAEEKRPINLAISLHATSDAKRAQTMPIAKKYSISEILGAAKNYFTKTGRRVSFEYALIQGVNDQAEDLAWLIKNLKSKAFHINLIPLNAIKEYHGRSGKLNEIEAFCKKLTDAGVHATVRQSRGQDIEAACGQLRANVERGECEWENKKSWGPIP